MLVARAHYKAAVLTHSEFNILIFLQLRALYNSSFVRFVMTLIIN